MAEFNQATNRFGTINLVNGCFTQIGSLSNSVISDIAFCPTNGALYGIRRSGSRLVTFNLTNGAMTTVGTLGVSSIQSLAFRPADGALFGATQSKLYQINPTNGQATLIGSFGSPHNLNSGGQNIRFAQDGNLYVSNTSSNTDLYRVSTQNGAAVWVGELNGFPNLILENGGQYMYGVSIAVGAPGGTQQELLAFDLNSFVAGGTNSDGSTHQIAYTMVGAGPHFPVNFNFSGMVATQIAPYCPTCTLCINRPQANSSVTVGGSGIVGQTYMFQASTNLCQWTTLSTNVADAQGWFACVMSDVTNYPTRFFRAVASSP